MNDELKMFFNNVIETLFPSNITCFMCGEEVKQSKFVLCEDCEKNLPRNNNFCLKCGTPVHSNAHYCLNCKNNKRHFKIARAPLIYKDKVAISIKQFKYENKKYLAKYFSVFLEEKYNEIKKEILPVDFIIPVPLYPTKLKERGYNQSKLLAEELSKRIDIPVLCDNLIRVKETKTQTKLSYIERQENLEGAFDVLNEDEIKGKVILLIDDVLTTGSTTDHCAKTLLKHKVKEVYVLTLATTDSDKA